MSISRGGIPPANSRNNRLLGQIPVQQMLKFRGQQFRIQIVNLSQKLFTSLGFDLRRFAPGATLVTMGASEYKRFESACGFEDSAGIYPLAINGDQAAVHRGEIPVLPNRSRNIILPDNYKPITLAHELLHDIFIGGGIEVSDRVEFSKNVLYWYRLSVDPNMPHQHNNREFFEKVAQVCAEKYNIDGIDPRYNFKAHDREEAFQIFAGECFAYAGEFLLHPNESMLDFVPESIVRFFRFIRLLDRSVYQQANGQA